MDISPISLRSISVRFERNQAPPPHYTIKVVDTLTDEIIRQIPSSEKPESAPDDIYRKANLISIYG